MSHIIIYGRGKTGKSLKNMLDKMHLSADFYEDGDCFDGKAEFDKNGLVLMSPGVSPFAKGATAAKKAGAKIVGELEFCFPFCKGKCISVTGTNGKTTTCEMIYHVLTGNNKSAILLGNGGVPFSSKVLDVNEDDTVVLESSSFQLDGCKNFSPYISVFTNLAPDHLNYHGSFEKYAAAKENNFKNQKSSDFAIFNADDKAVVKASEKCKCNKLYYSVNDYNADCYFDGDSVVLRVSDNELKAKAPYLREYAKHNRSNALAAVTSCYLLGIDIETSVELLKSYGFLPHRLQTVDSIDGVCFVDDSKATNVHATLSALKNYSQPLALILGGSDKGENFDKIFEYIQANPNVEYTVATGQTAARLSLCAEKYDIKITVCDDLEQAVKACFETIKKAGGGVVLMSNACASFDRFNSYAERGDFFQRIVGELHSGKEKV